MKKSPKCELNYIINDYDELCSVCKENEKSNQSKENVDDNKNMVEQILLPLLKTFSNSALEKLTNKSFSFEFLHLRLPLLVKCENLGEEHCKQEIIVSNSNVYRYYKKPYNINGQNYHICSQWWDHGTNNSKDILKLLKEMYNKKTTN